MYPLFNSSVNSFKEDLKKLNKFYNEHFRLDSASRKLLIVKQVVYKKTFYDDLTLILKNIKTSHDDIRACRFFKEPKDIDKKFISIRHLMNTVEGNEF